MVKEYLVLAWRGYDQRILVVKPAEASVKNTGLVVVPSENHSVMGGLDVARVVGEPG